MKNKSFVVKISFIFLLIIAYQQITFCQNKSLGYWTGTMIRDGSVMNVGFEFRVYNNQTLGYFNSVSQMASGIPLDSVYINNNSLSFQLMTEPVIYFKCRVSKNSIAGQIMQEGFSGANLYTKRSQQPINNFIHVDTLFNSSSHRIACIIYLPKAKVNFLRWFLCTVPAEKECLLISLLLNI